VADRYIGTSSRIFWVILSPVVPLLTNVSVFYFIARIPEIQSMRLPVYIVFMFSGLLPFRIIQKAAVEGCDLLVANMEMLKTAVFPLAFLSLSAIGALLLELLVQSIFMAVLLIVARVELTWTIMLLPMTFIVLFALALGISWVLSILNYALRDLQEVMGLLFSLLLYVTPIIYPPEAAPKVLQILIAINPLSSYVVMFRDVVLPDAGGLHILSWIFAGSTSAIFLLVGYFSVQKAQRFVGDMV
jgi:ABC-type polysaccharide/polyol phosphate export permease